MNKTYVAAGLLAAAVAGWLLPPYYAGLVVDGLIFAVFALGVNLLLGHTGLPSLGHAAYFGMGAYAAGLTAIHVSQSFWIGAAAGIGGALALGAVYGLLALRTTGVYFLMITLALGQIAWAVAFSWRRVTGGDDGLRGIPRPDLGLLPGLLDDRNAYFLFALAACILVGLLMAAIIRSPFGRALRGIRENPERMAALGYRIWLYKYLAFVLSAGFSGFAGVLFAYYKGFVSPEAVSIVISAEAMLMVIVGGAATTFGPVVGAFIIIMLSHVVSGYTDRWSLILGLLYIAVVLLAPQGVVALVRKALNREAAR